MDLEVLTWLAGRSGRESCLAGCLVANLGLGKMLLAVAVGRRWSTIASGWGVGRRVKDGEQFEGKPALRRVVVGCCCLLVPALLRRSTDSAG